MKKIKMIEKTIALWYCKYVKETCTKKEEHLWQYECHLHSLVNDTLSKLMSVYFFITRIKSITSNKMKERECKNFIIKVFAFISSNLLSKIE